MHKNVRHPARRSARLAYPGPTKEACERVLADFARRGITIRSWAQTHHIHESTVYQLLSGQKKGLRGEAHRAAVLLGLKDGIVEDCHA